MGRREVLATFLKGAAMGTADAVPGVSGGTIALVVGIYDRLVAAIASLRPGPLRHLARVHEPDGRAALREAWREMDLTFLVALGAGMGTAVVGVTQLIPVAFERIPAPTGAFFAGLIGASVVLIGRSVPWTPRRGLLAVVAAATAVAVATTTGGAAEPGPVAVFLGGTVAISAMVLPGLSGALLLLVLGQYEYMSARLDALVDGLAGLATGGSPAALVEPGTVVATFLAGAVVGLLTVARAVDYALERDRATTIAGLVGLMAGGVYPPATMTAEHPPASPAGAAAVAIAALLGVGVVAGFARATDDLDYVEPDDGAAVEAPDGSEGARPSRK